MPKPNFKFDDPKVAFAEATKLIEEALKSNSDDLLLSSLGLTEVPNSIGQLTSLESLHLIDNRLTTLPESMRDLKGLRALWLHNNPIKKLPEWFGALSNLEELGLYGTELGDDLNCVSKLSNLRKLWLGGRKEPTLPACLSKLVHLNHLYLAGENWNSLPNWLSSLKNLRSLDLSATGLTYLPQPLEQLAELEFLGLARNLLRSLPEALGNLTQLRSLDLSDNNLTSVPLALGRLRHLTNLNLSGNELTSLPESLGGLIQLRNLALTRNQLSSVPESLGELTKLMSLDLSSNHLSSLPDSLGHLTTLEKLNLSNNRLASLPYTFRNLSSLTELYLHGNDRLSLPMEVLGAEAHDYTNKPSRPVDVLDYYFRIRGGARPLNEAKLILLGRGEVGKTALVNRIVYDKFGTTSITKGIAITQWQVVIAKESVRLNVWDFGGQEIQHATHQFFLTERSLYLIVLNGRAGAEDEDAEYWLKFVKTFGGSSPTILVLNKFKVQPFEVNRRGLLEKYPFITGFVETDCKPKTKNGRLMLIKEIKSALAAMEYVRADFPADWFRIKERLAKMQELGESLISFEDYRKICVEFGESDAQAQERLAGFLNALGIALNFREDQQLREETVLNPHWITEGVYQIITSRMLANQKGELRLADLGVIFKGKKNYPQRMHNFLIQLMRKFELCFSYHDDPAEQRYLVPELLGKEKPKLKESFPPVNCLNFRYDYRLMPEGLLPRFITRTHTMSSPEERWRTGAVLRWENCRALVEADKQERQVLVRVLGEPERRRRLLAVIRENFDQIHVEMKEFKPTEWLGVPEHPDDWVSHRELEIFEQKKVSTMAKTVGDDVVHIDVTKALDATDVLGVRQRTDASAEGKRPLKLFISYAHEDEKWRAKLSPNLGLLVREGLIEVWSDLQIVPGTKWDDEIKRKMEEADIYLFLMSTDLLNSDYVQATELPVARKRHEEAKARLVPLVVRKCSWNRYVGDIQGLPTGGRAVKEWQDKDQAFHDVEEGLRKTIEEARKMLQRS